MCVVGCVSCHLGVYGWCLFGSCSVVIYFFGFMCFMNCDGIDFYVWDVSEKGIRVLRSWCDIIDVFY